MALYRLPFPEEDGQTWFVQNGGWDQGGHGVDQAKPTDEQAYAFDMNHETGGKVLAARAGTAIWLAEQWPDDSHPPETPGEGNFIWIRHGDVTMAAPTGCPSSAASIRQARKAGGTAASVMRCSSPRVPTRTVLRDAARHTPPGAISTLWSTTWRRRPDIRADGGTARTARGCSSVRTSRNRDAAARRSAKGRTSFIALPLTRCYQCQGLHHGGIVSGVAHKCPVGAGNHRTTGSKYRVQFDGA